MAADSEELIEFDIPPSDLSTALNEFSVQSEQLFLFLYDDVELIKTKGVHGAHSIESALGKLLQGTDLMANFTEEGVITVVISPKSTVSEPTGERPMIKKKAGLLAAIASIFTASVSAQDVDSGSTAKLVPLEEVVVTGVRASIVNSINQKRNANGFVDAISAEDLGKFPDLNISESLQRIPGVTLFRNNTGDGQSINLRGLGSQFTRVEINGVTGTSNGTTGRFGGSAFGVSGGFNFEVLASELFDNVSVTKSYTARQSEGGLAGLVELRTPHAFDRDGFNLSVSAQAQTSETADDTGPRAAIVLSQNWDDRFGVSASFAYSDTAFKSDSSGGISGRPLFAPATAALRASATPEQLAALLPQTINYQVDVEDRKTTGITAGFQFRPNERTELTVDTIFARIESDRFFTRADAPPESQISAVTNFNIANGVFQSGTFTDVQQRIAANDLSNEEDFTQVSAKVEFNPSDEWSITPFLGYSKRENARVGQLLSFARGDINTGLQTREDVTYTLSGQFIDWSTVGTDYSANSNPDEFFINIFLVRPSFDEDEEVSGKLDFSRAFNDEGLTNIDFGARITSRKIDRKSFEIRIDNAAATTDLRTLPTIGDALVVNPFNIDGSPASFPGTVITADPRAILNLYLPNGFDVSQFITPLSGPVATVGVPGLTIPGAVFNNLQANTANRTFNGQEESFALYAEASFEVGKLHFNSGVRYVDTSQESSGYSIANGVSTPVTVTSDYERFLPSMTLKYHASETLIIRAAYSRSLSRPTLFSLRVSESFSGIDQSGGSGTKGNPNLQPFTSDNIDVGIEWYFAEEGLVAATLFNKIVDGLIISGSSVENRTFLSQVTNTVVTAPITFTTPENGEEATITGLELLVQGRFSRLPGALSNLGGVFNYTYTESGAAFEENDSQASGNGLPGLSGNSFNAVLYYDDGRFDSRLSYAWRERFVQTLAGSFGQPEFQNDFGQLDLSANYSVTDNLTLQLQGLNLTNEQMEIESVLGLPHTTTQLDRRWFFGARYVF